MSTQLLFPQCMAALWNALYRTDTYALATATVLMIMTRTRAQEERGAFATKVSVVVTLIGYIQ